MEILIGRIFTIMCMCSWCRWVYDLSSFSVYVHFMELILVEREAIRW